MFAILDATSAAQALRNSDKPFYVYVLLRPDGEPFYVGKGLGKRIFSHEAEARNTTLRTHKLNVIRAINRHGGKLGYATALSIDHKAYHFSRLVSRPHAFGYWELWNKPASGRAVADLLRSILGRQ